MTVSGWVEALAAVGIFIVGVTLAVLLLLLLQARLRSTQAPRDAAYLEAAGLTLGRMDDKLESPRLRQYDAFNASETICLPIPSVPGSLMAQRWVGSIDAGSTVFASALADATTLIADGSPDPADLRSPAWLLVESQPGVRARLWEACLARGGGGGGGSSSESPESLAAVAFAYASEVAMVLAEDAENGRQSEAAASVEMDTDSATALPPPPALSQAQAAAIARGLSAGTTAAAASTATASNGGAANARRRRDGDLIAVDVSRCKFVRLRAGEGAARLRTLLRLWQARHVGLCYRQAMSVAAAVIALVFAPPPSANEAALLHSALAARKFAAPSLAAVVAAIASATAAFGRLCDLYLGSLLHPRQPRAQAPATQVLTSHAKDGKWAMDSVYDGAEARRVAAFTNVLRFFDPAVAVFLADVGLEPELYAAPFLLTLFADNLPLTGVLALWDVMLATAPDGRFPLFMATAVLQQVRSQLLGPQHSHPYAHLQLPAARTHRKAARAAAAESAAAEGAVRARAASATLQTPSSADNGSNFLLRPGGNAGARATTATPLQSSFTEAAVAREGTPPVGTTASKTATGVLPLTIFLTARGFAPSPSPTKSQALPLHAQSGITSAATDGGRTTAEVEPVGEEAASAGALRERIIGAAAEGFGAAAAAAGGLMRLFGATRARPADHLGGLLLLSRLKEGGATVDWHAAARHALAMWAWAPASLGQLDAWPAAGFGGPVAAAKNVDGTVPPPTPLTPPTPTAPIALSSGSTAAAAAAAAFAGERFAQHCAALPGLLVQALARAGVSGGGLQRLPVPVLALLASTTARRNLPHDLQRPWVQGGGDNDDCSDDDAPEALAGANTSGGRGGGSRAGSFTSMFSPTVKGRRGGDNDLEAALLSPDAQQRRRSAAEDRDTPRRGRGRLHPLLQDFAPDELPRSFLRFGVAADAASVVARSGTTGRNVNIVDGRTGRAPQSATSRGSASVVESTSTQVSTDFAVTTMPPLCLRALQARALLMDVQAEVGFSDVVDGIMCAPSQLAHTFLFLLRAARRSGGGGAVARARALADILPTLPGRAMDSGVGVLIWDTRAVTPRAHRVWAGALCARLLSIMLRRIVAAAEAAMAAAEGEAAPSLPPPAVAPARDGRGCFVAAASLLPALGVAREQCFQLLRERVRVLHLPLQRVIDGAALQAGSSGRGISLTGSEVAGEAAAGASYLAALATACAGNCENAITDASTHDDAVAADLTAECDVAAAQAAASTAAEALAIRIADGRVTTSPFALWAALASPLLRGGASLPYSPAQLLRCRGLAAVQPEPFADALCRGSELFRFTGGTPLAVYAGAHRSPAPLALLRDLLARAHMPFVSLLRADLGSACGCNLERQV